MKYLLIICLLLAAVGTYFYVSGEDTPQHAATAPAGDFGGPPLVVAEPVTRQTVTDTIEAIGTTFANESVTITAKVTDVVSRVNFEDGEYVEKGRILVEQANEEQSALLAEARANLEDARTQLRRLQDLGTKNLVPDSDIDAARAQADAAKARLDSITARMDDRLVIAPFSGLLGFRQVSTGALLTNSTPVTTLDDISRIKLDFAVPEIHLNVLKPGFRILARSEAFPDREFAGEVRTIGSRIDPVTRAVTVRAIVPNEERLLRPGMLLTVNIITSERLSLVVPESAVTQTGDETYVMIADPAGMAKKRPVVIGSRRYDFVEIIDGLEVNEQVITEGVFKVRDGARFRLQERPDDNTGQADAAAVNRS